MMKNYERIENNKYNEQNLIMRTIYDKSLLTLGLKIYSLQGSSSMIMCSTDWKFLKKKLSS